MKASYAAVYTKDTVANISVATQPNCVMILIQPQGPFSKALLENYPHKLIQCHQVSYNKSRNIYIIIQESNGPNSPDLSFDLSLNDLNSKM